MTALNPPVYLTHETSTAAMTDLLNAHPHLVWRRVDGRREVVVGGVRWVERAES